jgi:putative holliday junction resolvase
MKRWLGLDLGNVRIGVALSDSLGMTAQPLKVLKSEGTQKDLITLGEMVNEYEVTQVIVGLPINMDGTESKQTQKIRDFTQKLSNRLNVSVFFVDERLTSRQAERMMSESGVTSKKQRGKVDQIAAAILLQAALKGAPLTEVPRT